MAWSLDEASEEGDGNEIEKTFDIFTWPKFALAEASGAVLDLNFGNSEFLFGGDDGNIAVELAVEVEAFNDL